MHQGAIKYSGHAQGTVGSSQTSVLPHRSGLFAVDGGLSPNRTDERYGALFACLTTWAVYLDLPHSLSSEDLLNVLRRFVAT